MGKKKETLMRRGNFMTKPADGWLHNEAALAHGDGLYYSFPVKYLGSIQVIQSLSTLDMDTKTEVCREGIARTAEAAKNRKAQKRKPAKVCKEYLADAPYIKVMELKLNISCDGIATSSDENQIISNDNLNKISFAAGGAASDYFLITYVAKDKRNNRYCHVFDCGALANDVLATMGQTFNMIQTGKAGHLKGAAALAAAPKLQGNFETGNPLYFAMPVGGDAGGPIYDESAPTYDAEEPVYNDDTYDAPDGDAVVAHFEENYDNMEVQTFTNGEEMASFINTKLQSNHLYGDDPDEGDIYGDGQTGWEYLHVDPEAVYGDLAEFAQDQ